MPQSSVLPFEGQSPARERYNAGLGNLLIHIESKLEDAGAKMGAGSIFHPAWPATGQPPEQLKVFIVPFNASGLKVAFTREEIWACDKGVLREDVRDKVRRVVDTFIRYRSNAVRGSISPGN